MWCRILRVMRILILIVRRVRTMRCARSVMRAIALPMIVVIDHDWLKTRNRYYQHTAVGEVACVWTKGGRRDGLQGKQDKEKRERRWGKVKGIVLGGVVVVKLQPDRGRPLLFRPLL